MNNIPTKNCNIFVLVLFCNLSTPNSTCTIGDFNFDIKPISKFKQKQIYAIEQNVKLF